MAKEENALCIDGMASVQEKSVARKHIKKQLMNFLHRSGELGRSYSPCFAQILCASTLYTQADTILIYAAMSEEAPTEEIIMRCRCDGKKIALPKIKNKGMDFLYIDPKIPLTMQLYKNAYGIDEPLDIAPPFIPESFITASSKRLLVIVPALAFTRQGERLGRGGGFYDKYLPRLLRIDASVQGESQFIGTGQNGFASVTLCGMGYSVQICDTVPCEMHDVRMHYILTEKELIFCNTR